MSRPEVMIVAAEASSGLYALRLLQHWKKEGRDVHAFGAGTADMEALGFERIGKSEEMAVMGIAEIVSHYGFLKGIFDKLVAEAARRRPKVVILMDYPEFNLMLSKKLHELGIPVVYYIAPTVWAWRKGRVKTLRKYCDNVFLLFPFEVPFYQKTGTPHEFIGHPLLDEMDPQLEDPQWRRTQRQQRGIQDDEILIGLMPGSRRLEIKHLFPLQIEVARQLAKKHDKVRIMVLTAPTIQREQLQDYLEDAKFPFLMVKDDPFKMIAMTDYMLATSGTATLQVGLLKKPMVIMYKVSWLTAVIGRLVLPGLFGMPNLVLGRMVVPEFFQWDCTFDKIFNAMDSYLTDPVKAEKTREELGQVRFLLGDRGATVRVAKSLEKYLGPAKGRP